MKVLLFVQTGDARPKVFTRYARGYSGLFARNVEFARQHPETNISRPLRACANADRWWLVECENADEGRRVITGLCHSMDCALLRDDSHEASCDCGRILASGGKETL